MLIVLNLSKKLIGYNLFESLLYKFKLNFWRLIHDDYTQPAFSIYNESDNFLTLRVYDTRELSYNYETIVINTKYWENNEER